MKNAHTYYQLIIDKSGSMYGNLEETVEGVNQQVMRIKEIAGRYPRQKIYTSLAFFNQEFFPVWTILPAHQLHEISYADYRPAGTTALLDAIGHAISGMQAELGEAIEHEDATAVVVIFTDGYENASRHFTPGQISSLIIDLESTGKWTFSYIGSTLDAVEIATNLGIRRGNAMHFSVNDIRAMYGKLDDSLEQYIRTKSSNHPDVGDYLGELEEM